MIDTLSDLLRGVRLRGGRFFQLEGHDPWIAQVPASRELIPALLPGVEHMMKFQAILKGSCWAFIAGDKPIRLNEGDAILFPRGNAHVISSRPGPLVAGMDEGISFAPRPGQLPFPLGVSEPGVSTVKLDGGGDDHAIVVFGFLGCDTRAFNPLVGSLPRVLRMPDLAGDCRSWITHFLDAIVEESSRREPGGDAMRERMSDMLFVEILRRFLSTDRAGRRWMAGTQDAAVGRALAMIHEHPGRPWTLAGLSQAAALSRSSFHERFVQLIGQSPMQYLTHWRMQLATGWLQDTDAKVMEVALEVGYENETAFARAFRRVIGESPGAWRRARRMRAPGHTDEVVAMASG